MHYTVEYCADSFALLREPFEFDHIITDPPYTAHVHDNMMSGTTLQKVELGFAPVSDYAFVADMVARAKRWAVVFVPVEALGRIQDLCPERYVRSGIWYKPNSMGQLTGDRPAIAFEGLAILHSAAKKRWNGRGRYAHWICNGTRGEKDRHPNQKPLRLLCDLVREFTDPGETVFDPFCGSGRVGEAALLCGRNYVGLDFDETWVARARVRCAQADAQYGIAAGVTERECSARTIA